jgi:hypothetical protein
MGLALARPSSLVPVEGKGDEDVLKARFDHDFGFAHFGAGDAAGAGVSLQPRESRALVGLGVGSESYVCSRREIGHLADVGLGAVQVDDERRGIDVDDFRHGAPDTRSTASGFTATLPLFRAPLVGIPCGCLDFIKGQRYYPYNVVAQS